jgi:hypothetical protein
MDAWIRPIAARIRGFERRSYCSDSGGRWWPYEGIGPTATVDPLLAEIERDPTGIFWG